MISPKFMANPKWYNVTDDGEYLITSLAPPEAKKDYEERRKAFLAMGKKELDEYLDSEDGWLIFPQ